MNKYQEALDYLTGLERKEVFKRIGDVVPHPNSDTLQELVDKATPKKVCHTFAPHPTIEYDQEFDYFYCPNCGEWVNEKCMDNYCSICGQALDWSDKDESNN